MNGKGEFVILGYYTNVGKLVQNIVNERDLVTQKFKYKRLQKVYPPL